MKFFLIIFFCVTSIFAHADVIKLETLTSFADRFSFKDNRKNLKRDKIYTASKDCCGLKPFGVINAYPTGAGFGQVALWCDHCDTQKISEEQINLCKDEFAQLYKTLIKKDAPENLISKLGTDTKSKLKTDSPKTTVRFTTGSLKCDTKGGNRVRVDFFTK